MFPWHSNTIMPLTPPLPAHMEQTHCAKCGLSGDSVECPGVTLLRWRRGGPWGRSIGGAERCSRTMACPSNALIVFVRRSGASADSYCVILGRFRMYPQHDTRCECVFVPWGRALALLLDTQWKKKVTPIEISDHLVLIILIELNLIYYFRMYWFPVSGILIKTKGVTLSLFG